MKKDIEPHFRTVNLNLAIFLYVKSCQIEGVYSVGDKQKEFSFVDTPKLQKLTEVYRFGDKDDKLLMVQIHEYEQARNTLLDILNY